MLSDLVFLFHVVMEAIITVCCLLQMYQYQHTVVYSLSLAPTSPLLCLPHHHPHQDRGACWSFRLLMPAHFSTWSGCCTLDRWWERARRRSKRPFLLQPNWASMGLWRSQKQMVKIASGQRQVCRRSHWWKMRGEGAGGGEKWGMEASFCGKRCCQVM